MVAKRPIRRGESGFSLIEATIAMTISTILVMAVGSVFLVQSDFYGRLTGGAETQDHARVFVQAIQAGTAGMVTGGLVIADSLRLVVRVPQTLAMACAIQGSDAHSHFSAGLAEVDDATAAGVAKLESDGTWTFSPGDTAPVTGPDASSAPRCFAEGTDTVGARNDFMRLNRPDNRFGVPAAIGDIYMFYDEIEFSIATSALDSRVKGLYRGIYGESLTEYATGIDSTAYFAYRIAGTWSTTVSSGSLSLVDAIRVYARTYSPAVGGSGNDASFDMPIVIPLRNTN